MDVDRVESQMESDSLESTPAEDTGNLTSSFEALPKKGKKRGRKPKGTNCPGSRVKALVQAYGLPGR